MNTQLSCDLRIGLGDQTVKISGEGSHLTADFESLRAIRQFQRSLPVNLRTLPAGFPVAAVAGVVVSVVLRGRRVATIRTQGQRLMIERHWSAIFASLWPW